MNNDKYKFHVNDEHLCYEFDSVSSYKIVKKVVVFSPIQGNPDLYNLALVDVLADGSFSDKIVTDNKDLHKVIATVTRIILIFF